MIMLFLGMNTIIAYGAFAACLKYIEANKASIIVTLNPILTVIAMAVLTLLDVKWITPENITIVGFLGAGFVLLGAVLAVMPKRMPSGR